MVSRNFTVNEDKVLDLKNQLAFFDSDDDECPIILLRENLLKLVDNLPPEWESIPVVTLCVLGSDVRNTRTLLTSWLIHYYENIASDSIVDYREIQSGLKYVSDKPIRNKDLDKNSGIYFWPNPVLINDKIYLVLYSHCRDCGTLDRFCALLSSSIVTFKPSQKEEIQSFLTQEVADFEMSNDIKFINASACCLKITAFENGERLGYQQAWDTFTAMMEKKSPEPKHFADKLVTLKSFAKLVKATCNLFSREHQPDKKVTPPRKPVRQISDSEPLERKPMRIPKVKFAIEPDEAKEYSREDKKDSSNLELVYTTLETWVSQRMDTTNIPKIAQFLNSNLPQGDHDLEVVYKIIFQLNQALQNMHDNYVCFHGDRDKAQMSRFMEEAFASSIEYFNHRTSRNKHCLAILKCAKDKLFGFYDLSNLKIQNNEISLANNVTKKILDAYKTKLTELIRTQRLSKSQLQAAHDQMMIHCVRVADQSMNYGSRQNHVVAEVTKKLTHNLEKIYTKSCKNICSVPTSVELPLDKREESTKLLFSYDHQVKELIKRCGSTDSERFRQEHDSIMGYLRNSTPDSEREQLAIRLHAHLCHLDELNEHSKNKIIDSHHPATGGTICMFFTSQWVWLAAQVSGQPSFLIDMESPQGNTPGFPPQVAWHQHRVVYGHDVQRIPGCDHVGHLFTYLSAATNVNPTLAENITSGFLATVKSNVEYVSQQRMSSLILILPSWMGLEDKNWIRRGCRQAKYENVAMVTESALSAHYVLNTRRIFVLVVTDTQKGLTLEMFRGKKYGVQLAAVAYESWSEKRDGYLLQVVEEAYMKLLSQVGATKRGNVEQFIVVAEQSKWEATLDSYFRDKGLKRATNLRKDEHFLNAFSLFQPGWTGKFVETLATLPSEAGNSVN